MGRSALYHLFSNQVATDADSRQGLSGAEWEALVRQASLELVLPGVIERLGSDLRREAPAEILSVLELVRDLNAERNERILEELRGVATLLNGVGVEPVVLKGGAHVLAGLYETVSDRYLADLDLLVLGESLPSCIAALREAGYAPDENDVVAVDCHHYQSLKRPAASVDIELHHSLGMGAARNVLSSGQVLAESIAHIHRGAQLRLPSINHRVIHHIVHSQMSGRSFSTIRPDLRDMNDFTLLTRRYGGRIEWDEIDAAFCRSGNRDVLDNYLSLVSYYLAWRPPFWQRETRVHRIDAIRRTFLRTWPALRFGDPIYILRSVLLDRLQRARDLVRMPGGFKYLALTPFRLKFYKHLLNDF